MGGPGDTAQRLWLLSWNLRDELQARVGEELEGQEAGKTLVTFKSVWSKESV